jgi:hypothetical protein
LSEPSNGTLKPVSVSSAEPVRSIVISLPRLRSVTITLSRLSQLRPSWSSQLSAL